MKVFAQLKIRSWNLFASIDVCMLCATKNFSVFSWEFWKFNKKTLAENEKKYKTECYFCKYVCMYKLIGWLAWVGSISEQLNRSHCMYAYCMCKYIREVIVMCMRVCVCVYVYN